MNQAHSTTDNGYRSKCCLGPLRVGIKKVKKSNQKITVWVCCVCGTKDVLIVSREEALQIKAADALKLEPEDDGGYEE